MKILCIGDIMLDVLALLETEINYASDTRSTISTHGGGAAANVASWLAVNGTKTYLIARVGDDAAGQTVLSELDSYGVDHGNTVIPGAHTGVVIVLVDTSGERTMFPDAGANAGLGPRDLPDLGDFTAIYLSGYPLLNSKSRSGVLEILEIAREKNLPIIFDPASVGVLREVGVQQVRNWLPMMDVIVLNEEEAHFLSGMANPVHAAADLNQLCSAVIIKRGASGSLAKIGHDPVIQVAALPAEVVDTTGAGDAFAAGFIPVWVAGGDIESALARGSEFAARCVAVIGARPLVATP